LFVNRGERSSAINVERLTISVFKDVPGGLTGGATPVPIPNTEVKPSKADDTAAVRQWESRTLPGYKRPVRLQNLTGFFFYNPAAKPTLFSLQVAKYLSAAI
jgi:hypothetical protein